MSSLSWRLDLILENIMAQCFGRRSTFNRLGEDASSDRSLFISRSSFDHDKYCKQQSDSGSETNESAERVEEVTSEPSHQEITDYVVIANTIHDARDVIEVPTIDSHMNTPPAQRLKRIHRKRHENRESSRSTKTRRQSRCDEGESPSQSFLKEFKTPEMRPKSSQILPIRSGSNRKPVEKRPNTRDFVPSNTPKAKSPRRRISPNKSPVPRTSSRGLHLTPGIIRYLASRTINFKKLDEMKDRRELIRSALIERSIGKLLRLVKLLLITKVTMSRRSRPVYLCMEDECLELLKKKKRPQVMTYDRVMSHVLRTHIDEKLFSCPDCGLKYWHKSSMNTHRKQNHKVD